MCKELAKTKEFKLIWGFKKIKPQISIFDDEENDENIDKIHMRDVELVLRFFAFRQLKKFEGNLNTFLDIYLDNANKYDSCLQEQLRMLFVSTIKFAFELFDGHPFKLYSQKNNKIRSTKYAVRTIYDPFMQVLSQYLNHKQTILTHKGQIQEDYINMLLENEEEFSGKYQHKATIEERIALFDQFLSKYAN